MKTVVARFNEDIDWTNGLSNCVIYNKGPYAPSTLHPVVQLPNVGREGHTYLYHILQHYDALDDYTCFLQGHPFDHTPDLGNRLRLFQDNPVPFYMLSRNIHSVNLCYDYTDSSLQDRPITMYEAIFGQSKKNHHYQFGAGAQFIVSRDLIRSRPKSFYEKIMTMMDHSVNPPEGYVLERFWPMIFTHTE